MLARLSLVALAATAATADNYAVLIAGSNEIMNYRHHADIAHAYQVLTKGGYKADNIITMMYNDVPNDPENPIPGTLYNQPAADEATANELYAGVKDHLDYQGKDVTAANFLAVLGGDSATTNGKKVLTSGPDDNVFVYFADHGGTGIICTPDAGFPCSGEVHAADLISTFQSMHSKKMYKELVFYLEACESGSMFEQLPKDINVYAVSASNDSESSWGWYCPGLPTTDVKIGSVSFDTCLGDMFSVMFLENDDATDLSAETLQAQWEAVKKLTTKSPVMQWGDLSIASQDASAFEGTGNTFPAKEEAAAAPAGGAVDSRDIKLMTLYNQYMSAAPEKRGARAAALVAEIEHREAADAQFAKIAAELQLPEDLQPALALKDNHACWKQAHKSVRETCGAYSDYSLKHSRVVAAACNLRDDADAIAAALKVVCAKY